MSDRRVKFQLSSGKGSSKHHGREPAHDSGVGSLSSDQASLGGRPDRRFTEDYESQLYNVGSLQEALGQANLKVEHLQKKCTDLDGELTKAHRSARDADRRYREECDRNGRLERVNKDLEEEIVNKTEKIAELKAALDSMKLERDDYRQRYYTLSESGNNIRGGSGGTSPPRLSRSGSKHDKEKPTSSHHPRRSSSIKPTTHSSNRKPYIEKMPDVSSSSRHSGNYTTISVDLPVSRTDPAYHSNVPRSPHYATLPPHQTPRETGDYVAYPIRGYRG
ncbi:uncharacterized protein GGS25DRAFT_199537 [Hypoxylon fragiforme]|uniref:uncharacterized protein n=1 Tax=Hypoxylon fragiforme TaxID=63214 RepID=UPI0020C73F7D|nr:uncharacterized protein GGS25DRAFT_199537 [Hypoxylon fragiforme]KAI2611515.1 hypothetical protein GGS25DRAFT_199537 [Hypoxylon fragiforme]